MEKCVKNEIAWAGVYPPYAHHIIWSMGDSQNGLQITQQKSNK